MQRGNEESHDMAPEGEAVRRKPVPTAPARSATPPNNAHEPLLGDREPEMPVQAVPTAHEFMHWSALAADDPEPRRGGEDQHVETDTDSNDEPTRTTTATTRKSKTGKALTWAIEFTWCIISIALLGALAVILAIHNGKPIPNWPLGLTLNTVVALLATFCRASFVVAVTEGVSQLKWNWFAEKPRPLNDLEVFDLASRGPWGSIYSLFACRWSIANTLSAVVLVTGLATSTLTQSAITYSTRQVQRQGPSATSFSRRHYPTATNTEGHDRQQMVDDTNRAIFQAVFGPVREPWPMLQPECSSGECTWPIFSSLAVCVSMENVTEHLQFTQGRDEFGATNYTASLLNNTAAMSTTEAWPLVQMVSPEPPNVGYTFPTYRESVAFNDQPDVLNATFSQFFFIYNNDEVGAFRQSFRAVELLWHFCVNSYNVTVSEGRGHTEVVSSRTKVGEVFEDPQPMMRMEAPEGGEGGEFVVDSWWEYTRLDLDMRRAFEGNWGPTVSTDWPYSEANRQFGLKIFPNGVNVTAAEADGLMWDGIKDLAQAMADSMTNLLRQTGTPEPGTVLEPETFVRVRWEWLTFLAAQVGLSVVFLAMIVVQTARLDVDVVKSSALAGMFAVSGRTKLALEARGGAWDFAAGAAKAPASVSGATARLEREGGGWTLAVWPAEEAGEKKRRERQSMQRMAASNHQGFT